MKAPFLYAAVAASARTGWVEGRGGGGDLCVLFTTSIESSFHFGRIDFATEQVLDLLALPPSLVRVYGGCAAGADDGQFFIPNDAVGYNNLLEVNIVANTTAARTILPPSQYAGSVPVFFTMQLDPASDGVWAIFLESTRVAWVAAAAVDPAAGSSVAISADFGSAWSGDFLWKKTGVSALDSKRSLLFFVARPKPCCNTVGMLIGVPIGNASAPVQFVEIPGPTGDSIDIDFLGYSAPHDLFVATCFNVDVGIASVKTMPAGGAGGDAWQTVFEWPAGNQIDLILGNAALTRDGNTLYVALQDAALGQPSFFAFAVTTGKLLANFTVSSKEEPRMFVEEVVAC
jgi:hypothetical protein